MAYNTFSAQFTIPNGAAVSAGVAINGSTPVLLVAPAAWTAANVQLEGSLDGVTYFACRDAFGSLIQVSVAAGGAYQIAPSLVHGWDWLRLRSVTAGTLTDVNQSAERVLTVTTEKLTS